MKRAYLIEMTVLKDYMRQLIPLGFFVAFCISLGMQSIVAAPAVITMLKFMMGSMAVAAYDEQNNWGLFRLTMPVTRRDVVLARYAVILTIGCTGMAIGLLAAAVLTGVASAVELPGGLSSILAFDPGTILGMLFASFFCMFMGSAVASVITPVYFRFGQTKATQYLPMMTILIFIIPMLIIGSGVLDDAAVSMETLAELLKLIETPAGTAACMAVFAAASLVVLGISAAVSLRIYARREL